MVVDTQEPLVDTSVTKEPIVEIESNQGEKEEVHIHEPAFDTAVTQELAVETKAYQGKNDTQEPLNDTAITK